MPAAPSPKAPVLLVCGDDDFGVKERAREVFGKWGAEIGGSDHEIIDATVNNSSEALSALSKLRAALQTLPFFGSGKVVWLRNCNFMGEERAAEAQAVTENLSDLAQELKAFVWQNVRLLVSAGKVDKRKTFYKTLEKIGSVEVFAGWSAEDRNWADQAENLASRIIGQLGKEISGEALGRLVTYTGPHARALRNEIEKLSLYVGDRARINTADVEAIVTRQKQDEELWEMRRDPQHNEIGLLYGLISKVRGLIMVREMMAQKWLRPETDFNRFKSQLARIPPEALPEDKKFNPLSINPYVLFRALSHAPNYAQAELIAAMDLLLECNRHLVSRSLDPALLLQQALVRIMSRPAGQVLPGAA
jgi:DNA polymerase-3 subunit delta